VTLHDLHKNPGFHACCLYPSVYTQSFSRSDGAFEPDSSLPQKAAPTENVSHIM
jgi:hypothetical protein